MYYTRIDRLSQPILFVTDKYYCSRLPVYYFSSLILPFDLFPVSIVGVAFDSITFKPHYCLTSSEVFLFNFFKVNILW